MNLKYWNECSFKSQYNPSDNYLVVDWYSGGFNNVRMSFEVATALAYALNRKLIFPKYKKIAHLEEKNLSIADFFEMSDVIIEYNDTYNEVLHNKSDMLKIDYPSHETLYKVDDSPVPEYFKGSHIVNLHELENIKYLHFPGNLFGNFYHAISANNMKEICGMIKKHVHYKATIFDDAKKSIDILGDKQYYSIHIRRGDFLVDGESSWMHNTIVFPAEKIVNNIENVIPKYSKLYIASDEKNKSYFDPFKDNYEVFFYDDIASPNISTNHISMIEQIICARGISFVGTFVSTFSSYINRLRGYMSDIEDKRIINFSSQYQGLEDTENFNGLFSREYSIGWRV
jgi:hypothetical protein